MDNLSNSNKYKLAKANSGLPETNQQTPVPPQKPVLSKPKEESMFDNIMTTFFSGRNLKDAATSAVRDWLLPSIVNGIAESAKAAIDGFFYGGGTSYNSSQGMQRNPNFYNNVSKSIISGGGIVSFGGLKIDQAKTVNSNQMMNHQIDRYRYSFVNVTLPSPSDINRVKMYLYEMINTYGKVRVADFYDCCGPYASHILQQYTDNDWGWKDIGNPGMVRVLNGWQLSLPEPIYIKE